MVHKALQLLFTCLFGVLLIVPGAQHFYDLFERVSVYNIYVEKKFPEWSWESFQEGSWQEHFEIWFKRNHGLWGTLIRTANTINMHLFGLPASSYEANLVAGRGGAILERLPILDSNALVETTEEEREEVVQQLALLRSALRERGNDLLVIISPTKTELDPEFVPDSFRTGESRERNWELLQPLFEEQKIPYLWLTPLLQEVKDELQLSLFPAAGAHMNTLGKCYAAKFIAEKLEEFFPGKMGTMECRFLGDFVPPEGEDNDLARLMNVWDITPFLQPVPNVEVITEPAPVQTEDTVFVSGSSFNFEVLPVYERSGPWASRDFFFYLKRWYHFERSPEVRWKKPVSWKVFTKEKLLSQKLIILEVPESRVHQVGFGFVERALRRIRG